MAKKKSGGKQSKKKAEEKPSEGSEPGTNETAADTTTEEQQDVVEPDSGGVATVSAVTPGEGVEEEEELELLQVDLGDMVKMKQVLDEGVNASLLEHAPEDYKWDNIKLLLMAVSCFFAMIAQFAPIPFPQSRPVLGVCGSLYFIISGILQAITTFIDKDTIMLCAPLRPRPKSAKKNSNKNKPRVEDDLVALDDEDRYTTDSSNTLLTTYGIQVRTNMPRFSEFYTVILEFRFPPEQEELRPDRSVSATWSVGNFFDKEGYFDEVGLALEVTKLFRKLEAAEYNPIPPEFGGRPETATKSKTQ